MNSSRAFEVKRVTPSLLNNGFVDRQRMNRRCNQRKRHRSSVKIKYYLLVEEENSIPISLLVSIEINSVTGTWNRNDIKFIQLLDAGAENRCSSTKVRANIRCILFVLTFALWFSRFIGSHQFSQGNLVTIVITSLLAKNPAFQYPTSTVLLLLCYTGFFSAPDYCFLKFACLSSPQMLWGGGKEEKIVHGLPTDLFWSAMQFIFGFNSFWSQPDLSQKVQLCGKSHLGPRKKASSLLNYPYL